jgi:tetratricopeptide (TPR) repeat protein
MLVLIALTILVEKILHRAQHAASAKPLSKILFTKILQELALLGIVSFIVVICQNVPPLKKLLLLHNGFAFLMLELAHVMIFLMAIVYSVLIKVVDGFVGRVERRWERLSSDSLESVNQQIEDLLTSGERPPRRKLQRLIAKADFLVLQCEFKRQHKLTQVKKFRFVSYLSKALGVHIESITEPSLVTWAVLGLIMIIFIVTDSGQQIAVDNGWGHDEPNGSPWNFGPDQVSPLRLGVLLASTWIFAALVGVLWIVANRRFRATIRGIYSPHADVWDHFYGEKHALVCVRSLEHASQAHAGTVRMLYGFAATQGEGPYGTHPQDSGTTPPPVPVPPSGGPAGVVEAYGSDPSSLEPSVTHRRGKFSYPYFLRAGFTRRMNTAAIQPADTEPSASRNARARLRSATRAARAAQAVASASSTKRRLAGWISGRFHFHHSGGDGHSSHGGHGHGGGHGAHGHGPVDPILRCLEITLNIAAFFISFCLLFWVRQAVLFPYQIIPELEAKAQLAGAGDLSVYSMSEAATILLVVCGLLLLMFLPYVVILYATLHVIQDFSIADAVSKVDRDIMQSIEKENEKAGDYVSAMLLVRNHLARTVLGAGASLGQFKERVAAQIKLGEMYWRYRAVLPGESPLEEAIKVLDEAKALCERAAEEHEGADMRAERGQVHQGLGVARLVHHQSRSDDPTIEKLLREALAVREELEDHVGRAETLNSLGMLRMKNKRYQDAEAYMEQMVDLRERKLPKHHPDLAQGYMSLGSLLHEVEKHEEAIRRMRMALDVYVAAFHVNHPKVAWAHEGIAGAMMASGQLKEAQEHIEKAMAIRKVAQAGSEGHQLFSREIEKLKSTAEDLAQRSRTRTRLLWTRGCMSASGSGTNRSSALVAALRMKRSPATAAPGSPPPPKAEGEHGSRQRITAADQAAGAAEEPRPPTKTGSPLPPIAGVGGSGYRGAVGSDPRAGEPEPQGS